MWGGAERSVAAGDGVMSSAELSHTQPRQTPTPESPTTTYLPMNASGDSGPEADTGGYHKVAETGQKEGEGGCEAKKNTVAKGNNKNEIMKGLALDPEHKPNRRGDTGYSIAAGERGVKSSNETISL